MNKSKKINPGKKYRLLKSNEVIRRGDEFPLYTYSGRAWRACDSSIGMAVKDTGLSAVRRLRKVTKKTSKIVAKVAPKEASATAPVPPAPASKFKVGDKVVLITETYGDFSDGHHSNPVWGGKSGFIVGTVIVANDGTDFLPVSVRWTAGDESAYDESDLALLSDTPPTPGEGYRLLGDDEEVRASDDHINLSWTTPVTCWTPVEAVEGRGVAASSVRDRRNHGSPWSLLFFRRKVEKAALEVPKDYRLLADDEVIVTGDRYLEAGACAEDPVSSNLGRTWASIPAADRHVVWLGIVRPIPATKTYTQAELDAAVKDAAEAEKSRILALIR